MKTNVWSGVDISTSVVQNEDLKVPTHDLGKWIGVELEFISDTYTEDYVDLLNDEGAHHVDVKDDGSISSNAIENGNAYPTEFAVLTHINDMSNLRTALNVAHGQGAYVNASCGLHVHLDMRHLTKAQASIVAYRLKRALPLLRGLVAPYRTKSKYCRRAIGGKENRYAAINFHSAYDKFKTIEIRLHQGTLDYTKIRNWILLLYRISRAKVLDTNISKEELRDAIGLPRTLKKYVDNRLSTMAMLRTLEPSEVSRYHEAVTWL